MKLTLFFTLFAVTSCFSLHLGDKRDFSEVFLNQDGESSEPRIDFTGDWKEIVQGELGVGTQFTINYDGSRLPGRPTLYGQQAWLIFAEYKFDDGPKFISQPFGEPKTIDGKEIFQKTISIPIEAKKVVLWFRWSYSGENKYDSNYDHNYHFALTKPSIVFDKDWNEDVHGKLIPGQDFDLFYDSRRLKEDATIVAQMKFVDDKVVTTVLKKGEPFDTAVIPIPKDAEKLVMWFYYEDNGKKYYDSDYGKNYHFTLSKE